MLPAVLGLQVGVVLADRLLLVVLPVDRLSLAVLPVEQLLLGQQEAQQPAPRVELPQVVGLLPYT
ncbi:unnamed protein product, partial [marine sediment metagenome]